MKAVITVNAITALVCAWVGAYFFSLYPPAAIGMFFCAGWWFGDMRNAYFDWLKEKCR